MVEWHPILLSALTNNPTPGLGRWCRPHFCIRMTAKDALTAIDAYVTKRKTLPLVPEGMYLSLSSKTLFLVEFLHALLH